MSYLIEDETILHTSKAGKVYRIQFAISEDEPCPWREWDGLPPLAALYGRNLKEYDCGFFAGPLDCFNGMSDQFAARHSKTIFDALGMGFENWGHDEFIANLREDCAGYMRQARMDEFLDAYNQMDLIGKMQAAAEIWELRGVPALSTSTHGYCQGDYADLLFVATDEFKDASGIRKKRHLREALESAKRTYGAWAWGNVLTISADELPADFDRDEPLNSIEAIEEMCWCVGGFYPENDEHYFPVETNFAYAIDQVKNELE